LLCCSDEFFSGGTQALTHFSNHRDDLPRSSTTLSVLDRVPHHQLANLEQHQQFKKKTTIQTQFDVHATNKNKK